MEKSPVLWKTLIPEMCGLCVPLIYTLSLTFFFFFFLPTCVNQDNGEATILKEGMHNWA